MDLQGQNGLMSTFREPWRTRNALAWILAVALILFYTLLYFHDPIVERLPFLDLEAAAEAVGLRNRWLLYGLLYTVAMAGGAVYYLRRHGNAPYNRLRIGVNVGVQLLFAFLLPLVMPYFLTDDPESYSTYEFYFSYLWPLDWYKLHPGTLEAIPVIFAVYAIGASLIAAPILAYFFGKRWYCSWVCGCGGLANTFGDPWRHLTPTSTRSWRFEKVAVHTVMFLAIGSTFLLVLDALIGESHPTFRGLVAGGEWWSMRSLYGYVVGAILAGLVGVGFYPLLGPRIWCRNFCPMAATLGLFQKLGRFRITVKPDMCISCGNCTTYCEMGIDVRSYAQSNQSFTRAACVGCGMCAHVCPRGVLRLENAKDLQRDKGRVRLPVVDL
ncbi:MAG: 4Fe-4S binding protein [Gemmatimonadota bacterium]|nr:4Fe-4S binding protein [Gemmatimonadota bacterium]